MNRLVLSLLLGLLTAFAAAGFALRSPADPVSSTARFAPVGVERPLAEQGILSTAMRTSDHDVDDVARIVRGQIAVTHAPDGARLSVWSVSDELPFSRPLQVRRSRPSLSRGCFDLAVERDPVVNALGGRYGTYALAGASASTDQDPVDGRPTLRFQCERGDGACGLWIHLYETTNLLQRTFVDATEISRLVFWARARSADAVSLKVADAAWGRREDAAHIGALGDFMHGPELVSGWRRVLVPLDAFPRSLARDSLATIVFEANRPGRTEIEVAALQLCAPGAEGAELPVGTVGRASTHHSSHRALWVWNTREILGDEQARETFLAFVQEHRFDRVFLQLVPAEGQSPAAGFVPFDGEKMGALVADLDRRGADVYALDGDPAYALPANHDGVLGTVSMLLAHNAAAPPEQRFHGVRYDIEPYLLPHFRGTGRERLLAGYLDLLAKIAVAARGSLAFGVDVPFWLDGPEESTGEPITVTWRGRRASLLDHIVGQVDDIAVMAYRTAAYGADGSLAQAHGELEAASVAGIHAYVALETGALPDEDAYGFRGTPERGLPPSVGGPWIVIAPVASGQARVWLVPAGATELLRAELERARVPQETVLYWRSDPPARIAAERQSFERLGLGRLEMEAARIDHELGEHPAFAGVAYHHYGSLALLAGSTVGVKAENPR